MKTKKAILIFIGALCLFAAMDTKGQTILKNVPIVVENNDPYTIEAYAYNDETLKREWKDIRETQVEHNEGWYATREINIYVNQFYVEYFRFKVGSEEMDCFVYTYVEIHGGQEKEVIKDRPELRKILKLDGKTHIYGKPIAEPEQL